ncbi:MAG: ABC transporter substrate-binding protein, partial [Halapricum sp.]
ARDPVDVETLIAKLIDSHDYDFGIAGWGPGPEKIDPNFHIRTTLHSDEAEQGGRNKSHYRNEEYDELAVAQSTEFDQEARQDLVNQCQEIYAQDQPYTVMTNPQRVHPVRTDYIDIDAINLPLVGEAIPNFHSVRSLTPLQGDTVVLGHPTDLDRTNPLNAAGAYNRQCLTCVYDTLYRFDPDTATPMNWLASDDEIVDDTTFQVTIRDDATFHDGEAVTASDVAFSYNFIKEYSPVFGSTIEAAIADAEALDDTTVQFNLSTPFAPLKANIMSQIWILPEHIWADVPDEADDDPHQWDNPVIGSGPFTFDYYERGQEHQYHAFEDHFEPPGTGTLLRVTGSDMSSLTRQLENGEVHCIGWAPSPTTIERLQNTENIEMVITDNMTFHEVQQQNDNAPFDDTAFRRAIAYMLDKRTVADTFYEGFAAIAETPVAKIQDFWHNSEVEYFEEEDVESARQTLEDAGYSWDDDGNLLNPE